MKRTFASQVRHDEKVLEVASRYLSYGYRVFADLRGWEVPEAINGFRPDIVLIKENRGIIIEVQTSESLVQDRLQLLAFRRLSRLVRNLTFKLILI